MSMTASISLLISQLGSQCDALTNALTATLTSNKADSAHELALAREKLMGNCNTIQEQLVQLQQAVMMSPQQIQQLLEDPDDKHPKSQSAAQPAPKSSSTQSDSMDVDQTQQQQQGPDPAQIAGALKQQHQAFLLQLVPRTG